MADQTAALVTDVVKLPRWAVVAFAARCARRVLPSYFQGETTNAQFTAIVYYAVWAAQQAAAQGQPPPKPPAEVQVSRLTGWTASSPSSGAIKCASLAYKIAKGGDAKDLKSLLSLMPRVASKHPGALLAVRRDLEQLAATARERDLSDDSPVPETAFGPMWQEEAPPGWPIDAPMLDPARWHDWLGRKSPVVPRMDTRWVHTAFAVRCTHRVLPLMHQCADDGILAMHAEAVWLAAQLAASPNAAEWQEAVTKLSKELAAQMHKLPVGLPNHINYSLGAARMTIWLAQESLQGKQPNNMRSREQTCEFTRVAADSLGVKLDQVEERDWEHVLRWAVAHSIQADTGVPQSVFGPLWEKGPPKAWPEPAEMSLDSFRAVATRGTPPAIPEVAVLPRWAAAAFCARILERVTPWMAHKFRRYLGEKQIEAVRKFQQTFAAILERPPPTAQELDRLLRENRASVASMADELHMGNPGELVGFGMAIYDLDRFLHPVLCARVPQETQLAWAQDSLKRFADSLDGSKGILGFSQLVSDELTHLKRGAAAEQWTNEMPVPPSTCGPLWPQGVPKWWPV